MVLAIPQGARIHQILTGAVMKNSTRFSDILQELRQEVGEGEVSVGDVVSALRYRGFGPMLLVVALMTILPTGVIPGVPTLTAVLIVFISAQLLMGRTSPWITKVLAERRISHQQFERVQSKAERLSRHLDRIVGPRFTGLINGWSAKAIAIICCLIALSMPPLEMLPFFAFVPAATIALLGMGLTVRDGLLIILAGVWLIVAGAMAIYLT